jgi:hypothetical protein
MSLPVINNVQTHTRFLLEDQITITTLSNVFCYVATGLGATQRPHGAPRVGEPEVCPGVAYA